MPQRAFPPRSSTLIVDLPSDGRIVTVLSVETIAAKMLALIDQELAPPAASRQSTLVERESLSARFVEPIRCYINPR
jgi:hypothetical protein